MIEALGPKFMTQNENSVQQRATIPYTGSQHHSHFPSSPMNALGETRARVYRDSAIEPSRKQNL